MGAVSLRLPDDVSQRLQRLQRLAERTGRTNPAAVESLP